VDRTLKSTQENNLLHHHKQRISESLAVVGGMAAAAAMGALAAKGLSSFRSRYMSCKSIEDPYQRDMCTVRILDSMIENMMELRGSCDNTADPAACKLELAYKIDKLTAKKARLQQGVNRKHRARIIDRETS
jgi:hypothetical protein